MINITWTQRASQPREKESCFNVRSEESPSLWGVAMTSGEHKGLVMFYLLFWALKTRLCWLWGNSLSYTLWHMLFSECVIFQERLLLPPLKHFFPLSSVNKCWTNIYRIIVWSGARSVARFTGRICLGLSGHQMCISLDATHFIVPQPGFPLRSKGLLSIFFPE